MKIAGLGTGGLVVVACWYYWHLPVGSFFGVFGRDP
jgi:hypothetical protein